MFKKVFNREVIKKVFTPGFITQVLIIALITALLIGGVDLFVNGNIRLFCPQQYTYDDFNQLATRIIQEKSTDFLENSITLKYFTVDENSFTKTISICMYGNCSERVKLLVTSDYELISLEKLHDNEFVAYFMLLGAVVFYLIIGLLAGLFSSVIVSGTKYVYGPWNKGFFENVLKKLSQKSTEPASEPVFEPISEPVSEPVPEPVSEPVPEPVSEPVPEPASEPVSEPMLEPASKPVSKHNFRKELKTLWEKVLNTCKNTRSFWKKIWNILKKIGNFFKKLFEKIFEEEDDDYEYYDDEEESYGFF